MTVKTKKTATQAAHEWFHELAALEGTALQKALAKLAGEHGLVGHLAAIAFVKATGKTGLALAA